MTVFREPDNYTLIADLRLSPDWTIEIFLRSASRPALAAITKQQFKRHFIGDRPGLVGAGFFNLYWDPREEHGMMQQMLWSWGNFELMKERHEELTKEFPNTPPRHGEVLKGIKRASQ